VERWPSTLGLAAMCFGARGESLLLGVPGERRVASAQEQVVPVLREVAAERSLPHRPPGADARGWLGWISYDAGRVLEPSVEHWHAAERGSTTTRAASDRSLPLAEFVRIDRGVIVHAGRATPFGEASSEIVDAIVSGLTSDTDRPRFVMGPPRRVDAADFERRCGRVIEYIRAGDVYQVNLAHRMECAFEGSPRALFAAMLRAARPWHGAYFEGDSYAIASASPELFLELDAERRVFTRPMKGTRPTGDAALQRDLLESAKDQAELAMIVDLMRNDLGRVCVPGSMRVDVPREIERHDSGVLQATATVSGTLSRQVSRCELLRATFPAGSVTGAPKVRAMQIIDELEPVRRGPYCGSMVWLGDDGTMKATVLIRTAVVSGGGAFPTSRAARPQIDYSVGAGIVADSVPRQEWRETLDKSAVLERLAESKKDQ
jgi:para-aminobenzoate synthetase component 1